MDSLVIILIMSAFVLKTFGDYLTNVEEDLADIDYEDDDYDEGLEVKDGQPNTTEKLEKALKLFEETMDVFKKKYEIKEENLTFYEA
ncbi:unnamed protein product [Arctia plantaginis]|uniref:Uncharacterized protein n=1 Tax=Arctia plantaginis TaxID=874455 RepID=A0A8S0ZDT1_ARCPL|nr:unnamed protein product [Arctia plantaginis]